MSPSPPPSGKRNNLAALIPYVEIVQTGARPALPAEAEAEVVAGGEREDLAAAEDGGFPGVAEFGLAVRGVEGFVFRVGRAEWKGEGEGVWRGRIGGVGVGIGDWDRIRGGKRCEGRDGGGAVVGIGVFRGQGMWERLTVAESYGFGVVSGTGL